MREIAPNKQIVQLTDLTNLPQEPKDEKRDLPLASLIGQEKAQQLDDFSKSESEETFILDVGTSRKGTHSQK